MLNDAPASKYDSPFDGLDRRVGLPHKEYEQPKDEKAFKQKGSYVGRVRMCNAPRSACRSGRTRSRRCRHRRRQ